MNHTAAQPLVDAFLDGELAPEERWAVAAHLADCPACADVVAAGAAQRQRVRAAFSGTSAPAGLADRIRASLGAAAGEPATTAPAPSASAASSAEATPPRLVALPNAAAPERTGRRMDPRAWLPIAAAVALLLVGAALLRSASPGAGPAIGPETIAQHQLFAQDESLLDAQGEPAAVAGWLGNHLPFGVPTPTVPGYTLLGARLVTTGGQPAAQLVYEREAQPKYLSMIWTPAPPGGAPPVSTTVGATTTYSWDVGSLTCTLVADRSAEDLQALARGMTFPGGGAYLTGKAG